MKEKNRYRLHFYVFLVENVPFYFNLGHFPKILFH